MAAPLVVTIPHQLGKEEAQRRVKGLMSQVTGSLPMLSVQREIWTQDQLDFELKALGQVISGLIDVGESNVRIEITLPLMLRTLGAALQRTLESRGKLLLDKKP